MRLLTTVYFSTGGFSGTPSLAVDKLVTAGVSHIELSGGDYEPDWREKMERFDGSVEIQMHNYFPVPPRGFVINLASNRADIRNRSIEHAIKSMELSAEIGCERYSVHAGFLVDPPTEALGRPWPSLAKTPKDDGVAIFMQSISVLSEHAYRLGLELLVENNVLTVETCEANGDDALLISTSDQILETVAEFPANVGLLLDLAHLNVTARTVGKSRESWMYDLLPHVRAFHVSENDGLQDSGAPITKEAWFGSFLNCDASFITIEVAESHSSNPREQVRLVQQWLGADDQQVQ